MQRLQQRCPSVSLRRENVLPQSLENFTQNQNNFGRYLVFCYFFYAICVSHNDFKQLPLVADNV